MSCPLVVDTIQAHKGREEMTGVDVRFGENESDKFKKIHLFFFRDDNLTAN